MNQTAYYNIFLYFFLVVFLLNPLSGRLIKPSENGEEKEILVVNSKRRLYYPIKSEGLIFNIKGPMRLEFISRLPVLRDKSNSYPFQYRIVLDDVDTINVKHKYKVQKSIKSVQHPKHSYTYSGNYFINLEEGEHKVELIESSKQKYPSLVRVLTKEFENPGKQKKILSPTVHKSFVSLKSNKKDIKYYECSSVVPLKIEAMGRNILKIMSRLEFNESMGQEESYRIRVREGKKVLGTYFFNTERSSASQILERPDIVPGKWRSCEIIVPKGIHSYTVEIADKEKTVLTRFILY